MQKLQPQANRLPPPRTLIMDYTRWGIKGRGQNQNTALQKLILESPGPHCLYTFSRGHYGTVVR